MNEQGINDASSTNPMAGNESGLPFFRMENVEDIGAKPGDTIIITAKVRELTPGGMEGDGTTNLVLDLMNMEPSPDQVQASDALSDPNAPDKTPRKEVAESPSATKATASSSKASGPGELKQMKPNKAKKPSFMRSSIKGDEGAIDKGLDAAETEDRQRRMTDELDEKIKTTST